jgi:ERF superfamily
MVNLFKALAAFQQEVPVIHKATKGYSYTYADLPTIFVLINPILKKHGLGFTQLIQGSQIETIIFHCESGETLKSISDIPQDVELKGMNKFQVMGSAITYFRRYALSSALGLITDKDTDAGGLAPTETQKGNSDVKKDLILHLGKCESMEDIKILWDSLDSNEQKEYKDLFSKRKSLLQ